MRRPVVQRLLTQAAQLVIDLVPVVAQRLDAVRALFGIEVALAEDGPRSIDALLDLELRHHPHSPGRRRSSDRGCCLEPAVAQNGYLSADLPRTFCRTEGTKSCTEAGVLRRNRNVKPKKAPAGTQLQPPGAREIGRSSSCQPALCSSAGVRASHFLFTVP